jgi:transposase
MKDEELRRQVMLLVDEGLGAAEIARRLCRDKSQIVDLRLRYLMHGREAFLSERSHHVVSAEQKREIVAEHFEKGVSLCALSREHDLTRSAIKEWLDKAKAAGYGVLSDSHYGRYKGMGRPKKERPVPLAVLEENRRLKREASENRRLRKELELLRTENALLKKVKALVEARDARQGTSGRKPSKD